MFSLKSGRSRNRDSTLVAKVCLTFLSASNSHFILYALRVLNCFLVLGWFRSLKMQTTWRLPVDSSSPLLTQTSTTEENKSTEKIQKSMISWNAALPNFCTKCTCKSPCAKKKYLLCTVCWWHRTVANTFHFC